MFESVTSFFHKTGDFFTNGFHTIQDGIHNAYNKITGTGSNIINTVYADAKQGITGVGNILNKVVDTGKSTTHDVVTGIQGVIMHGQDTVGNSINSLGSSLSLPLVLGAGLFGFLMLKK